MKINVLEPKVFNRISAGEVVERPASIVKELVENSIDAGSKNIKIEITEGGIKNITISDDGCGIEKNDLVTAFLPHATSKIKNVEDLDNIESLGFRGEALASIASVCQVKLSSKVRGAESGYSISVNGGAFDDVKEVARIEGTTISCSNLFFNTPVRAKFLRKPKTEESEITHLVEKFMLSNSEISFSYYIDGKLIYNTTSCSQKDIIYTIYGNEIYENLVEVDYEEAGYKINGYITKPKVSKSNRTYQTLFVNGRFIESFLISNAVQGVYESFLMKGRFPVYVLSLTLPSDCVDVNVHPSKREVKFENPGKIFSIVRKAIEKALLSVNQIAQLVLPENNFNFDINSNKNLSNEENIKYNSADNLDNISNFSNNENLSQQEKFKKNMSFGKSFSVDLFDKDSLFTKPKEYEIENETHSKEQIIENEIEDKTEENQSILNSEKLDENSKFYNSQSSSTYFFDQSKEEHAGEISKENSFLQASVENDMKIIGTIFKTYIVVELYDSVYFIDQHAGCERILFDKLVKQIDEGDIVKQDLLLPYSFTVGALETKFIDSILPQLTKIGFDIEKNNSTYKIKSLPLVLIDMELGKFVSEILSENISWEKKNSDFIHSKLCQTACKHSIKAGDELSKSDIVYILENIRKGVMLCPHGRPVTLQITKTEFEKMFKRIV